MKKGYLTPPVLIVLALITLFVAAAIFFNTFLLKGLKKEPAPSPTPSIQPSPKSATDETASWKKYRNEKYNFQFLYPSDWGKVDSAFGEFQQNLNVIYLDTIGEPLQGEGDVPKGLAIKIFVIDSDKSYTVLAKEKLEEAKGWDANKGVDEDLFKFFTTVVGMDKNIPVAVINYPGLYGNEFTIAYIQLDTRNKVILYGNYYYDDQDSIDQFDQILSTFQFTN